MRIAVFHLKFRRRCFVKAGHGKSGLNRFAQIEHIKMRLYFGGIYLYFGGIHLHFR